MTDASEEMVGGEHLPKLLIVDDDINLRKLLTATFDYGKFKIFVASNGVDAIRMANQIQPDIVLLDVMLPGEFDGFDVCKLIKAQPTLKNTYVIMLTALGQKNDREQGEQAGADAYFVKPFSPLQLIDLIESLYGA